MRILIVLAWVASGGGVARPVHDLQPVADARVPALLEGHNRVSGILHELKVMSSTYRRRLDVVAGCLFGSMCIHTMMVARVLHREPGDLPDEPPGFGQHLLIVPLTLFTTAVPLPFGALGLSEQVSSQLFELVRHPGGALAMMGFRVLMYAGGLVAAGVYLANLRQVRSLTETAEELEDGLAENELAPTPQRAFEIPESDTPTMRPRCRACS